MPRVFVSIGSNIERRRNIVGGVAALRRQFGDLTVSPVYETPAVGFQGDPFLNLVVAFETALPLEAVIERLHDIERAHGRQSGEKRFAPRTLDLDVLLYGDTVRHEGRIDVPRGEIVRYAHVLVPLCDIAAELRHPELGERLDRLLDTLEGDTALREVALSL